MFLSAKAVAASNRYVENSPEDRDPVFKHGFAARLDVSGGILRYSTTTTVSTEGRKRAARAMARVAASGN
ncbi:hypothetical protein RM863_11610 [Streptomyces sp. DSM 41014]|uniref:Uncharacterized protein n=1 Tax=Streptomyces hintoniae TaxID=3075521 RepID=A0ABU2UHN5_9ACTN|nr:hypothetical protein [Streptomyces sp. DSM 41014]MDT0472774.1 hypothetical protein [Streptomyces sp. DSM 41014]